MGLLEWECNVCLWPIKSSLILFHTHNACTMRVKNWKNRLSTCRTKLSSFLKEIHNIWVGAEFARGRVCQGPSLSGAEMSRNRPLHHLFETDYKSSVELLQ